MSYQTLTTMNCGHLSSDEKLVPLQSGDTLESDLTTINIVFIINRILKIRNKTEKEYSAKVLRPSFLEI